MAGPVPRRGLRRLLVALLALPILAGPLRAQLPAPPVVAGSAFQFGGYGGITFSSPEHPEDVEGAGVSELDAAAMAWGRLSPRASYLVELDMAKQTTATWTGREADERLTPVRLYLEYTGSDRLRLRAGRFLTPFGRWNEFHADPLTWTPTRPLTTYRPFAKSLTGVMLAGETAVRGKDTGYALFWSPVPRWNEIFEESEESTFGRVLGARIASGIGSGLMVGVSLALVERQVPEDPVEPGEATEADRDEEHGRPLLGVDVLWATPRVELSAEGSHLPAGRGRPQEDGVFVQGAFRIGGPVWAVGRAEYYSPVAGEAIRTGYAGLTIRGTRHLVVKVGRQFSQHPSETIPGGWFLSFSSLF